MRAVIGKLQSCDQTFARCLWPIFVFAMSVFYSAHELLDYHEPQK